MEQVRDGEVASQWRAPFTLGNAGRLSVTRAAAAFLVYAVAFSFAFRYGMSFSHVTASPFWFPDSILLCALLLSPMRWWWMFVLGALPIRLALGGPDVPVEFAVTTFAIDSIKCAISAAALRHLLADPLRWRTVRDYALYCLVAVLLVPALGAFAGASARSALGYDYWASWQQWFLGNVLTHLIVTPAILYGIPRAARAFTAPRSNRWIEGLLVAAGLFLTSYAAFHVAPGVDGIADPWFYAPVPFLFWAALRFGILGASGALVLISVISVEAALSGRGPFAGGSPNDVALALQQFLLLRAAPLFLVAILSEQKDAAENELTASERRYRDVVESQADLVCRFLPDGTLSFVNEAFCRAFQRSRDSLVGTSFVALLPESARGLARAEIERCGQRGERGDWECQAPLPGQAVGWQHWLCHSVVDVRSRVEEFQAICHDITDRKRAEEADRSLTHASRMAVMGELTAMVAHEIKQPLTAILSNTDAAEILLRSPDPSLKELREILADIRASDLQANESIRRVRALVQKQEICLQPMDLNSTIADVLRLTTGDLLRTRVALRNELAPSLPLVFADRVHLQHVVLNVVLNAMDAMKDTPSASRSLTVRTSYDGGDDVEVVVADRGHGIAPDKLSGVFESFFTTKSEGMGLGLSIARSIIRSHRGRIWAENEPDGGASLHFTVKVHRDAA